jgi:hypothetical protein
MPVLIDEAYHHFVDDPAYATSIPYVIEGRRVIVARTFSKIAALAGMRLGYAVAPPDLIQKLRPFETGTVNAMVKWGGAAAIKDIVGIVAIQCEEFFEIIVDADGDSPRGYLVDGIGGHAVDLVRIEQVDSLLVYIGSPNFIPDEMPVPAMVGHHIHIHFV